MMRFPVNFGAVQVLGSNELPLAFFNEPNGDLVAMRGSDRWVASDFASLMELVLPLGMCQFQIPTKLAFPSSPKLTVGLLRMNMSLKRGNGTNHTSFEVQAWIENNEAVEYDRASASEVDLLSAIENAIGQLVTHSSVVPARCICCKYSDYEPHTTVGNLRCYLGQQDAYCAAAEAIRTDSDARRRIFSLPSFAVDDFGTCAAFTPRPARWGYRG